MSEEKILYSGDEVARQAGVSYGTLLVFLKRYPERIPCEKHGRRRLFPPRAIEAVKEISREHGTRLGRHLRRRTREKAASDRVEVLIEKAMRSLREATACLESARSILQNNRGAVVVSVQILPNALRFRRPLDVLVEFDGPQFVARLVEVDLSATGNTRQEAVENLRAIIVETYHDLVGTEREQWPAELQERGVLLELMRNEKQRRRPIRV
jgi:hypothetical protein